MPCCFIKIVDRSLCVCNIPYQNRMPEITPFPHDEIREYLEAEKKESSEVFKDEDSEEVKKHRIKLQLKELANKARKFIQDGGTDNCINEFDVSMVQSSSSLLQYESTIMQSVSIRDYESKQQFDGKLISPLFCCNCI